MLVTGYKLPVIRGNIFWRSNVQHGGYSSNCMIYLKVAKKVDL